MGAEIEEFAVNDHAGLFEEFTSGGGEEIFAVIDEALRNRPRSFILLRPERAARMREHNFEAGGLSSKQQDACAHFGHAKEAMAPRPFAKGRQPFLMRTPAERANRNIDDHNRDEERRAVGVRRQRRPRSCGGRCATRLDRR